MEFDLERTLLKTVDSEMQNITQDAWKLHQELVENLVLFTTIDPETSKEKMKAMCKVLDRLERKIQNIKQILRDQSTRIQQTKQSTNSPETEAARNDNGRKLESLQKIQAVEFRL